MDFADPPSPNRDVVCCLGTRFSTTYSLGPGGSISANLRGVTGVTPLLGDGDTCDTHRGADMRSLSRVFRSFSSSESTAGWSAALLSSAAPVHPQADTPLALPRDS